jgi:hypothetical protein
MRRTTVRIDDQLLADAKALAAREHRSLNSVIEDALRQLLNRRADRGDRERVELPVYGEEGGRPLVDMSPEGVRTLLEEDDLERYFGGRA